MYILINFTIGRFCMWKYVCLSVWIMVVICDSRTYTGIKVMNIESEKLQIYFITDLEIGCISSNL